MRGDFGRQSLCVRRLNEFDRTLQSQMYDVTMRTDADGSSEHGGEVEQAAPRYLCQRGDLYRFIKVDNDIISEPFEYVLAQHASCPAFQP